MSTIRQGVGIDLKIYVDVFHTTRTLTELHPSFELVTPRGAVLSLSNRFVSSDTDGEFVILSVPAKFLSTEGTYTLAAAVIGGSKETEIFTVSASGPFDTLQLSPFSTQGLITYKASINYPGGGETVAIDTTWSDNPEDGHVPSSKLTKTTTDTNANHIVNLEAAVDALDAKVDTIDVDLSGKQDTLIAGTGISIAEDGKTISSTISDVTIESSFPDNPTNTTVPGTLLVKNSLNAKQDTLIAGTGITIARDGKTISADPTTPFVVEANATLYADIKAAVDAGRPIYLWDTEWGETEAYAHLVVVFQISTIDGIILQSPGDNVIGGRVYVVYDNGIWNSASYSAQERLIAGTGITIARDGKTISADPTTPFVVEANATLYADIKAAVDAGRPIYLWDPEYYATEDDADLVIVFQISNINGIILQSPGVNVFDGYVYIVYANGTWSSASYSAQEKLIAGTGITISGNTISASAPAKSLGYWGITPYAFPPLESEMTEEGSFDFSEGKANFVGIVKNSAGGSSVYWVWTPTRPNDLSRFQDIKTGYGLLGSGWAAMTYKGVPGYVQIGQSTPTSGAMIIADIF